MERVCYAATMRETRNTSELQVLVAGTDDMHDTFLCVAFTLCFAFRRCENASRSFFSVWNISSRCM